MSSHQLNMTHAYTGRLTSIYQPTSQAVLSCFEKRLRISVQQKELPFVDYPFAESLQIELPKVMERLPKARHCILLGVGGSALGAQALQKAFAPGQDRPGHEGPWLWVADNIDVDTFVAWQQSLSASDTIVVVVSKSGSTIETMAQFFIIQAWLQKELGATWKEHFVFITDAEKGALRALAEKERIATLPVPSNLGGRYSVFSAVGMFPAAFLGMDWQGLLRGAQEITAPLLHNIIQQSSGTLSSPVDPQRKILKQQSIETLARHPAFLLAQWAYAATQNKYSQLIFFNYIPLWSKVGAWFSQLWAESLGKEGKGSMPLPAVGVTDQHSLQQMFLAGSKDKACVFLESPVLEKGPRFGENTLNAWGYLQEKNLGDLLSAEAIGTRMALVKNELPLVHISLERTDEEACGRLMSLLMLTTLFTGWLLEVNPLDQPAVEQSKRLANVQLGASNYKDEAEQLQSFLGQERSGSSILF